jgi:large subunit ribosomal protein L10
LEKNVTLRLKDKEAIVSELSEVVKTSVSAIAADYRGLTVSELTELRSKARSNSIHMQVVRNTLARRAVADTDYACLDKALVGPLVLLFSKEEPGAAAKLLRDFAKEHENVEVKAIAMGGELFGPESLQAIASLPSKEEAIAQLLSVMMGPATKLVRTMSETYAQAVRVVSAVGDQKAA